MSTVRVLQPGNATCARVSVLNESVLQKDYQQTALWFRCTAARLLTSYEARICRHLPIMRGLPVLLGKPNGLTLHFRFVPGENSRAVAEGELSQLFFERLEDLLGNLRSAGILHLDVGRNVLYSPAGEPGLCDFAGALRVDWLPARIRRLLIRLRERYDLREISKLKKRKAPHLLEAPDYRRISEALPFERYFKIFERIQTKARRFLVRAAK